MSTTLRIVIASFLASPVVLATDSFNSELSHFVGNTALASVSTVAIHKYSPKTKKPALKGFIISASEAVLGEAASRATGGKFSSLDAGVGILGAACGAYATDKWYIAPRLDTQKRETTCSVMVVRHF